MKILNIFILLLILISCQSEKNGKYQKNDIMYSDNIKNNNEVYIDEKNIDEPNHVDNYTNAQISIDFNAPLPKLAYFGDRDMIQNITVIYRSESDAIENINDIEPDEIVNDILNKPFENIEQSLLLSEYSNKTSFNGINELLSIFGINLSQDIMKEINSSELYRRFKFSIKNMDIYIYRDFIASFKLFLIEYNENNYYKPKLKIGKTKGEILKLLGKPSAYSPERNIFVYESFKTLRQITIFFDNNEDVKSVQLIAYGGV